MPDFEISTLISALPASHIKWDNNDFYFTQLMKLCEKTEKEIVFIRTLETLRNYADHCC